MPSFFRPACADRAVRSGTSSRAARPAATTLAGLSLRLLPGFLPDLVPGLVRGVLLGMLLGPLLGCGQAPDEPLRRWQVEAADLDRGRVLMASYQCGSCHSVTGVPGNGQRAPELARFGRRAYIAGQLPNSPETLQRWLLDPPGLVPGTAMPRLGLSERDARDIAGYLLSLK